MPTRNSPSKGPVQRTGYLKRTPVPTTDGPICTAATGMATAALAMALATPDVGRCKFVACEA